MIMNSHILTYAGYTRLLKGRLSLLTSYTAHVDTRPKTHSRQTHTSPRGQGHTPHMQGVSEACLGHSNMRNTAYDLECARTYVHGLGEADVLEQHRRWSYKPPLCLLGWCG